MSRTINATLQTRLNTGSTTLCHIITITRKDGTIKRFTDHDQDVIFSGNTYQASDSLVISAITSSANNGIQSTNCNVIFGDTGIDDVDVIRGLYDSAVVEFAIVDYTDTTLGKLILLTGLMSVFNVTNKKVGQFEIRGLLTRGEARIGEYYSAECRADLGDARCGVDTSILNTTGTVDTVTSQTNLVTTLDTNPADGYYSFGVITFTSGNNVGISMEVLSQGTIGGGQDRLILSLAMPFEVEVGDEFDLIVGCDKRLTTCINKFNNVLNFRGEPFVPGSDYPTDVLQS